MKNPDALSTEILALLHRNGGDKHLTLAHIRGRLNAMALHCGPRQRLSLEYLKQRLRYDPVSGLFTWLEARSDRVGKQIYGGASVRYVSIALDGIGYLAHVLAWFYMTGVWPTKNIDHKNGLGKDNRWVNLRESNQSQNMANAKFGRKKKSGLPRGVFDRRVGVLRYLAIIKVRGINIRLGAFSAPSEASAAYESAAVRYFGDFAFSNRKDAL